MNEAVAFLDDVLDLAQKHSLAKHELHANARTLAGLDKTFPSIQFVLTEQEQFDQCLNPSLDVTVHACGNDLGVIDNKHVTLAKIIKDVIKMAVRDAFCRSIQHHQARGVALFHRVLRNQLLGQMIVKIRRAQFGFG